MNRRKPLGDALGNEFVFGDRPTDNSASSPSTDNLASSPNANSTLADKLRAPSPREATVRITVDLSESMHRKLSLLAAQSGRKKAEIVRILLQEAFDQINI